MPEKVFAYGLVLIQFICLGIIAVTGPLIASGMLNMVLEAAAVLLGLWAIVSMQIGNFNVTHEIKTGGQLVTHGPYRVIRNPMYTAVLGVALVLVINEFSWMRAAVWAVLLADLLVKIRFEESLLAPHFEGYAEYKNRTKRLIPYVF